MRRSVLVAGVIALAVTAGLAQQAAGPDGPYKIVKTAKVGGEGGFDYITADSVGRRLYIPRGATRGTPATATAPEVPASVARIMVYDLDTLAQVAEIPDTGATNGAAVDPKSGHGFGSSHPDTTMFDTKTNTLIKKIPVPNAAPPNFSGDGIYFDAFNDRVYVFSHPTKDAAAFDAKDGTLLGRIDLGGVPEQGVSDGKGTLYVVMQDKGDVAVVDVKTMKTTKHYPFGGNVGCNGLALDVKNQILFAACSRMDPAPGAPAPEPGQPPAPPALTMIILSATDGKIITKLPLGGGSDGMVFNPATMEAFSTGGGVLTVVKEKSPASFEVVQNLPTMPGARTIAFDSKTNRIFTMSVERGQAPPPPPGGGRGGGAPAIPGSFTVVVVGPK